MKAFKRFTVVHRVYESDATASARTARAMDKFYDHKNGIGLRQPCVTCQENRVCFTAGALYAAAQKAAEPRFEEHEVDANAHPGVAGAISGVRSAARRSPCVC